MESKPIQVNLANYYILPLLSLSKNSYGVGNFVNAFVSDRGEIVIEVLDYDKVPQSSVEDHPNYLTDFSFEDQNVVIVYSVPQDLQDTLTLFTNGQYSKFSEKAKNLIRTYSGLAYKDTRGGKTEPFTADLLLVLEKDPGYRARLGETLDVKIPEDVELKSKPSEHNFYHFN